VSNDNVSKLIQPGCFDDQLTEIAAGRAHAAGPSRRGQVTDFLAQHAGLKTEDG
jgi:putative transposase